MKPTALLGIALTLAMFDFGCERRPSAPPAQGSSNPRSESSSTLRPRPETQRNSKPAGSGLRMTRAEGERTFSSLDWPNPADDKDLLPAGLIKFTDADLLQVLDVYQELAHRTVIRSTALPSTKISIRTQTALTHREALQAMDTVLAQNNITMIPLGTKFVKAVPSAQAVTEAVPVVELPPEELPECGCYMLYIVPVRSVPPHEAAPALAPFSKMPNSILAVDSSGLLLLRDYSTNIRRMLQVLDRIEAGQELPAPPAKP